MKLLWPLMLLSSCLINCTTHSMWNLLNLPTEMKKTRNKLEKCKNVYPVIFETKDKNIKFEGLIYARIPLPKEKEWERIALVHSYSGLMTYTIELQRQKVYGSEHKGITHDYVEISQGYALTKKGKMAVLTGSVLLVTYAIKIALEDGEP